MIQATVFGRNRETTLFLPGDDPEIIFRPMSNGEPFVVNSEPDPDTGDIVKVWINPDMVEFVTTVHKKTPATVAPIRAALKPVKAPPRVPVRELDADEFF